MGTTTVTWVPASAAEVSDRRRPVRTSEEPDVSIETILFGLGVLAGPAAVIVGSPQPLGVRTAVGLGFGLLMLASCLFSRHGLYLDRRGVTVWRGVLPRRPIPWSEVASFGLVAKPVDLGHRTSERIAVHLGDGTTVECWWMNRTTTFETQGMRAESAKARQRSFPELVDQLNHIRDELAERHVA